MLGTVTCSPSNLLRPMVRALSISLKSGDGDRLSKQSASPDGLTWGRQRCMCCARRPALQATCFDKLALSSC